MSDHDYSHLNDALRNVIPGGPDHEVTVRELHSFLERCNPLAKIVLRSGRRGRWVFSLTVRDIRVNSDGTLTIDTSGY